MVNMVAKIMQLTPGLVSSLVSQHDLPRLSLSPYSSSMMQRSSFLTQDSHTTITKGCQQLFMLNEATNIIKKEEVNF